MMVTKRKAVLLCLILLVAGLQALRDEQLRYIYLLSQYELQAPDDAHGAAVGAGNACHQHAGGLAVCHLRRPVALCGGRGKADLSGGGGGRRPFGGFRAHAAYLGDNLAFIRVAVL